MLSIKWIRVLSGFALVASAPAFAADTESIALPDPDAIEATVPAEPADAIESEGYEALGDAELNDMRGGDGLIMTDQTLVAITTGNVINGDYTAGNVSLSDFSLSNFTGFGNVLINTGAQVSLQTGMNVTINIGN